MQQKRVPMRKCMGCGEMKPKRELVRVVKSSDGSVSVDHTSKKSGRGAYVCCNPQCLQKARKAKRFERAFQCVIPDEVYEVMERDITKNG